MCWYMFYKIREYIIARVAHLSARDRETERLCVCARIAIRILHRTAHGALFLRFNMNMVALEFRICESSHHQSAVNVECLMLNIFIYIPYMCDSETEL